MVARATAPNRVGPGSVFPDASKWDFNEGLKGNATGFSHLVPGLMSVQGVQWISQLSGSLSYVNLS
jgi:hypothetical protein